MQNSLEELVTKSLPEYKQLIEAREVIKAASNKGNINFLSKIDVFVMPGLDAPLVEESAKP